MSHSPDLIPRPVAPKPKVSWSPTSPRPSFPPEPHSHHRRVSLLGGNSFGFNFSIRTHCLPLLFLGISRHQPTGDLPAARPTATRTLHAKTLELVVSSLFSLPSFLAAALQTQPGNTQHNRLADHLNRARAQSALGRHWISFAAGGTNGGGGADPFAPSRPAQPPSLPSSVFPYLTTSLSLDHFMNWAGPRPSGWRCSTGCANFFERDATC